MKLTIVGEVRRDCSYEFNVKLTDMSVKHLIREVLKRVKEYGRIKIDGKAYEYEHGRIIDYVKDDYNKRIKNIRANGGYSAMDYYVITE